MSAELAAEVTARFAAHPAARKVLFFWGGANDWFADASAATIWQRYQDYVTAFKAANPGAKIVGFTLVKIKGGINPSADEATRLAFNALLTASVGTVVDAVVLVGEDSRLQDPTDLTYWNADGVHLNTAGCGVVAELAKVQVDALP